MNGLMEDTSNHPSLNFNIGQGLLEMISNVLTCKVPLQMMDFNNLNGLFYTKYLSKQYQNIFSLYSN